MKNVKKKYKIAIGIVVAIAVVFAVYKFSGSIEIGGKCSGPTCSSNYSGSVNDNDDTDSASQENSSNDTSASPIFGDFQTQDIYGKEMNQNTFEKSNLTMVNIWATYCTPCISEMPSLGELAKKYDGKMQIVGIVSDVNKPNDDTALKIIKETKANYTHLLPSSDMTYLSTVQAVPTTIFIDKNGNQVGQEYSGATDKATWTKIIDSKLKEVNSTESK